MAADLDPRPLVLSLHRRRVALELQTLDLCFLAALQLRIERSGLVSVPEEQMLEVFQQVVALTSGDESSKKRSTHVLRRLREQKLLVRVDGAGVLRTGEYALTRLATGIVAFYLEDEALTRESLEVLAVTLSTCLEGVRDAVVAGRDESSRALWPATVVGPLRVTLFELASGIERRQRGFDLQQEVFQRELAALLAADWFGAVERCATLLDSTSAALRELNEILLRHGQRFAELLEEIREGAVEVCHEEAERAARDALEQVERIGIWGAARQRAWSEYHEWVHRYLREVVRLDPSRTLVHRLREQLAGRGGRRYALAVAQVQPMHVLRPVSTKLPSAPVRRPKRPREVDLELAPTHDPDATLRASVRSAVDAGARGLAQVTARVCDANADVDTRYRAAGRVAQVLPELAPVTVPHERPWLPAGPGMVVEEWTLGEKKVS